MNSTVSVWSKIIRFIWFKFDSIIHFNLSGKLPNWKILSVQDSLLQNHFLPFQALNYSILSKYYIQYTSKTIIVLIGIIVHRIVSISNSTKL